MILGAAKHYKQYQKNNITTSNQGQLILMMYEGAIKNISMAIDCIRQKDIPGKGLHIRKSHDIINELSLALCMKKGGDISKRLERLYQFILNQLALANIKSETKVLETTLDILKTINHKETYYCIQAERALLEAIGGDCDTAIGGLAKSAISAPSKEFPQRI